MKENIFCFIILHYLAVEDTIECIESICKRFIDENVKIVVVDNASPDNTGDLLENNYKDKKNINVIHCKLNQGFSKGNNIGIKFARDKYNPDYIIVINNDTVVIQDDFLNIIQNDYKDNEFAVLGPKILDPDNCNNSNPLYIGENKTVKNLKMIYKMWRKQYIKVFINLDKIHPFVKETVNKIDVQSQPIETKLENIELHGCCLIFSRKYFEYYNGFEELTFMYGEESILKMNCDKYNLKLLYDPHLNIYHKEGVSTKKERKSKKSKLLFYKRMMFASKQIYLKRKKR